MPELKHLAFAKIHERRLEIKQEVGTVTWGMMQLPLVMNLTH
ncbi:hypothetical protein ACQKII_14075 [Lysinibacillus sp. NPDC048646]